MTNVTIVTKTSHINMTNYDCDVIFYDVAMLK
jgi:hypothetical protein